VEAARARRRPSKINSSSKRRIDSPSGWLSSPLGPRFRYQRHRLSKRQGEGVGIIRAGFPAFAHVRLGFDNQLVTIVDVVAGSGQLTRKSFVVGDRALLQPIFRAIPHIRPSTLPVDANRVTYIRSKVWRDMRTYLKRFLGTRPLYIAILELHESRIGHLHVLVSRYLPHAVIKRFSMALGGGKVVDIRHVGVRNVSAYLSGYLSKETDLPPGVRHVTTARGLTIWPEAHRNDEGGLPPEFLWQRSKVPIEVFRSRAVDARDEIYTEVDGARELSFFVASGLSAYAESRN
jgi:hypothetical protein